MNSPCTVTVHFTTYIITVHVHLLASSAAQAQGSPYSNRIVRNLLLMLLTISILHELVVCLEVSRRHTAESSTHFIKLELQKLNEC